MLKAIKIRDELGKTSDFITYVILYDFTEL